MVSSEWRNFLSYKKVPNTDFNLYLRRIHLIRGTTQIGLHPLTRILTYTPPGNGCGFRQSLLPCLTNVFVFPGFRSALESPFSNPFHTAIPPPAALCDISEVLTPLSHRFVVVGTYHNAAEWICQPLFSDNLQSVRQGSATKQNPTVLGPISRHSPVYVTG